METAMEAAMGPKTAQTARLLMNWVTTMERTANAVASTTGLVMEGKAACTRLTIQSLMPEELIAVARGRVPDTRKTVCQLMDWKASFSER